MAVETYLNGGGWQLLGEEKDAETRRHSDRLPALCKNRKNTLVIAKLDRLGRDVRFVTALLESKVNLLRCDKPHGGRSDRRRAVRSSDQLPAWRRTAPAPVGPRRGRPRITEGPRSGPHPRPRGSRGSSTRAVAF